MPKQLPAIRRNLFAPQQINISKYNDNSKKSNNGEIVWQKTIAGHDNDTARGVIESSDGTLVVAGSTLSFGAGSYDIWIAKLHSDGVGGGIPALTGALPETQL